jgi:hypothetical protein
LIVNDLDEARTYKFAAAAIDQEGITSELRSNSVDMDFHSEDGGGNIAVGLAIPQPYINEEATHMEWPAIPNAVGYSVSVNSQEQAQITSPSYRVNELYTGIHQLRVRALGNGYNFAHSAWSGPIHVYQTGADLTAPFTQINVTTASWTPVSGATSYEVSIDGSVTRKTELTYPLDTLGSGTHNIKVRAINGTSEGAWSNTVTHTVANTGGGGGDDSNNNGTLLAPSIKSVSRGGVEWTAIAGATSYDVDKNGTISNQTGVNYSADKFGLDPEGGPGVKTIKVRARNGNNVSDWSNGAWPTVGIAKADATLSNNVLSWNELVGAHDGYDLNVDGTKTPVQSERTYSVAGMPDGVHQIVVRGEGRVPPYLYGDWSDQIGWTSGSSTTTPAAPFIGLVEEVYTTRNHHTLNTPAVWWSAVLGATGYDVSVNGVVKAQNQQYLSYIPEYRAPGTQTVKVRSVNGSYTSDWSNEITFDPSVDMESTSVGGVDKPSNIQRPTLGFAGASCTWNAVSEAKAYEFQVNGCVYITDKLTHPLPSGLKGGVVLRVRALNNFDKLSQWSNVIPLEIS